MDLTQTVTVCCGWGKYQLSSLECTFLVPKHSVRTLQGENWEGGIYSLVTQLITGPDSYLRCCLLFVTLLRFQVCFTLFCKMNMWIRQSHLCYQPDPCVQFSMFCSIKGCFCKRCGGGYFTHTCF